MSAGAVDSMHSFSMIDERPRRWPRERKSFVLDANELLEVLRATQDHSRAWRE
jgi:hypothetical protein